MNKLRYVILAIVFLWFAIGGLMHFIRPDAFLSIMPPYIPYAAQMVWLSGAFELLGALGLLWQPLRQWAGYGLIALTICVTPANIYMWLHPDLFPSIPQYLLGLRLVLQVLLIIGIWWATRPVSTRAIAQN